MQIHHLVHSDRSIRCTGCGQEFEISRRALTDPEQLMEWKEGIAAKHTCRIPRRGSVVRVLRMPTGEMLSAYWSKEMRRMMPART